jgi:hypothetical protein
MAVFGLGLIGWLVGWGFVAQGTLDGALQQKHRLVSLYLKSMKRLHIQMKGNELHKGNGES